MHVTKDNSDGRQQTLTGSHTTHHTNGTLFQNRLQPESNVPTDEYQQREENLILVDSELTERDCGTYKIVEKKEHPSVQDYTDSKKEDLLDWCLKRDIAWVIVGALGDQMISQDGGSNIPPVGSSAS